MFPAYPVLNTPAGRPLHASFQLTSRPASCTGGGGPSGRTGPRATPYGAPEGKALPSPARPMGPPPSRIRTAERRDEREEAWH